MGRRGRQGGGKSQKLKAHRAAIYNSRTPECRRGTVTAAIR
jgi:hypothetical protein